MPWKALVSESRAGPNGPRGLSAWSTFILMNCKMILKAEMALRQVVIVRSKRCMDAVPTEDRDAVLLVRTYSAGCSPGMIQLCAS